MSGPQPLEAEVPPTTDFKDMVDAPQWPPPLTTSPLGEVLGCFFFFSSFCLLASVKSPRTRRCVSSDFYLWPPICEGLTHCSTCAFLIWCPQVLEMTQTSGVGHHHPTSPLGSASWSVPLGSPFGCFLENL